MKLDVRCLSIASAVAALLAPNAAAQCVGLGGGGAIPGSGAVDGTWPTVLPTAPLTSTLAVTVPTGATVLNSIKLNGLSHTWVGDMQIVLQDPAGGLHNVFQQMDGNFGGGCGDDAGGDYVFADPNASGSCSGNPVFSCGTGVFNPGTYGQYFGAWPSGSSGINNTPLEQIPISSGNWTLYIYDWYVPADAGALTSWELCFGSPTPPPSSSFNCVSGGAGGSFPSSGAVDGTWPTILPTGELSSTLAVTVPAGATKVKAVKLHGVAHAWLGDCQIVLETPSGQVVNLFQNTNGVFGGGCGDDFVGDYTLVDPASGIDECGNPATTFSCGTGTLAAGTYNQEYGTWPSGSSGIDNVGLESVAIASGNYTLRIYDWYIPADGGTLGSWELCFDGTSGPTAYCTAGTSTNGCTPSISATAQPSATLATPCVINVTGVEGQKTGLIFYGINNSGFTPPAWGSGSSSFLCVKAPTQRMQAQSSFGTGGLCDGALTQDWNAYQTFNPGALGSPFSAGDSVFAQAWYRDPPAVKTTNLSNGLEMTMTP